MISNILNSEVDFFKFLCHLPSDNHDNLTNIIPLKLLRQQ